MEDNIDVPAAVAKLDGGEDGGEDDPDHPKIMFSTSQNFVAKAPPQDWESKDAELQSNVVRVIAPCLVTYATSTFSHGNQLYVQVSRHRGSNAVDDATAMFTEEEQVLQEKINDYLKQVYESLDDLAAFSSQDDVESASTDDKQRPASPFGDGHKYSLPFGVPRWDSLMAGTWLSPSHSPRTLKRCHADKRDPLWDTPSDKQLEQRVSSVQGRGYET